MATDVLPPEQADNALDFLFDGRRAFYSAERVVWGRKIELRVVRGRELQVAEEVAVAFGSGAAQALERSIQTLATAIVSIAGKPWGPEEEDQTLREDQTLAEWRIERLRDWPALLLGKCYDRWKEVCQEFDRLMDGDALGESSGAAASTGA